MGTSARRLVLVSMLLCGLSATVEAQLIRYHHLDAIGSVRALTGVAGTVVERHDYLPFGEECTVGVCAGNPAGSGQPRKFTGKERDQETGLDYFGARYHGSRIARFTTVDPVYTVGDNLVDPQRWNRYAYVRNNPLRYVDPDGRKIEFPETPGDTTKLEYQKAKEYLAIKGGGSDAVLNELEAREETIRIVRVDSLGHDDVQSRGLVIYWNPRAGVRSDNGETQSPALGLLHEADHTLDRLRNPRAHADAAKTPDPVYSNQEDRRVITGREAEAARRTGEDVRTTHGGSLVRVGAVDERPPKQ